MLKDQGEETQMNLWKARLSGSKQTCLKQLSKHEGFASRLNALRDIPGLWDGLLLGNAQDILALRCDEVTFPRSRISPTVANKYRRLGDTSNTSGSYRTLLPFSVRI
jgi:hypothetical protein